MSKHGNEVARIQCPECDKDGNDTAGDNFIVHETGYAKCYACDHYEYDVEGFEAREPTPKKVIPFVEPVVFKDITARGIKEKVARHYGYGFAHYSGATVHVAPFKDDHGNLMSQKLRFKNKSFIWTGLSTRRFFGQHLHRKGKRLAITEGELDCLSVAQVIGTNWPVVSLASGAGYAKVVKVVEENIGWLNNFQEIVLFMDADEEGREAVRAFSDMLPGKCLVAQYPEGYKDANALLVDKREADIKTAYWNAVTADADDDLIDIDEYGYTDFTKASPVGYSLPFPGMEEALGGLRKGELTLFTAGTGVGKSTITKEIGHHLAVSHKLKIGNVYMEEQDVKSFQSYIALELNVKLAQLRLDPTQYSEEVFEKAKENLKGTMVFAKGSSGWEYSTMLGKLEKMAVTKKCDFIILDHISMAVEGMETENEARAIGTLMKHLYNLIDRTGVGIIAVVHLRKPDGDRDWTSGIVPTINHLKGSSSLGQYSYNIYGASRDKTDDDERLITYLWQLKSREWGERDGVCTDALKFNTVTGRLDPIEKFPEKSSAPTKKKKGEADKGFAPVTNEDF